MEYYFKYSLTEDDFAEANVYTSWSATWLKKARLIFVVKSIFYGAMGMGATFFIFDKIGIIKKYSTVELIIASSVILVFSTAFTYYQAPLGIRSKSKKLLIKEENRHILDEGELFINDDKIISIDSRNMTDYKWESIVKYASTKEYFFLYINSIQALIVPKRIFISQVEIDGFDNFLTQKIPLASSFRSIGI